MGQRTLEQIELAVRLSALPDDVLVGSHEVAALTGYALKSIQNRRIASFPAPEPRPGHLKWNLGRLRAWMHGSDLSLSGPSRAKRGRPTKIEQMRLGQLAKA